jgi:uncharacterized repeat protein (TIGR03943 family)
MRLEFDEFNQPLTLEDTPTDSQAMEYVKSFVLLGLAGYFIYIILAGTLDNYINVRFAWLTYLAVALFALLGAITLRSALNRESNHLTSDHTPISWSVILIMALPLILGTLVPSRALGAEALQGNINLRVGSIDVATTVQKDPLERNVLDWIMLFSQPGTLPAEFDGQQADFIGFVITEPTHPDDHFILARSVVRCCVVDLSGLGIPVYMLDLPTEIQDDQWVRVRGTFQAGTFDDQKTPILQVTQLDLIDAPEQEYLYP